jgi:hypothetical protein
MKYYYFDLNIFELACLLCKYSLGLRVIKQTVEFEMIVQALHHCCCLLSEARPQ